MTDITRRQALAAAAGTAGLALGGTQKARAGASEAADAPAPENHRLWYRLPADTPRHALVVGNGRLGAMIAGQVRDERIPLNEDTLWSGFPRNWNAPDCRETLEQVRGALFAGDYAQADSLTRRMQGPFSDSYAPLATLNLLLDHDGAVEDYARALDLDSAIATISYSVAGVRFRREIFVSHPAQLILVRLSADRPGALNAHLGLDSLIRHEARADLRGMTLTGKAPAYCAPNYKPSTDPVIYSDRPGEGMAFAARLELLASDGRCDPTSTGLHLRSASEALFAISAGTGFRAFDRLPDTPGDVVLARILKPIAAARASSFEALRAAHMQDHRRLYRRMSLDLGGQAPSPAPTDERLAGNAGQPEPALAALYFNFSRYLLIASSRPGTQAANLQGIWSWEMRPPWSSNYTTNINIQQNYWGAESCNLAELHEPLIDFVEQVAATGGRTAKAMYGLDGWCVHHNSDLWRLSTPVGEGKGNPTWANFALAGPWLARHIWEHYLYGQDREFLARRGYPLLKGCALFCAGWLVRDPRDGTMTTAPSVSTENIFAAADGKHHSVSTGCTFDIAVIRELFGFTAQAAAILGVDEDFAAHLTDLAGRLPPYKVGGHGQLQEWRDDFAEPQPQQRHVSHLYPVAPGWEITPRSNPLLAKAAHVSIMRRLAAGGAETGWSRAWAVNLFARLGDGERAHDNLNALLKVSTGPTLLDVLPSANGPLFQIDGNFAGGAGIVEMIVQSHGGVIAFLPALPRAWAEGALRGVRLRGGVTADMRWSGGMMRSACLTAHADGELLLRAPGPITAVRAGGKIRTVASSDAGHRLQVVKGMNYSIEFA